MKSNEVICKFCDQPVIAGVSHYCRIDSNNIPDQAQRGEPVAHNWRVQLLDGKYLVSIEGFKGIYCDDYDTAKQVALTCRLQKEDAPVASEYISTGNIAPPAVPDGMVMMPREPTEEMLFAGIEASNNSFESVFCSQMTKHERIYRAMIDAAQNAAGQERNRAATSDRPPSESTVPAAPNVAKDAARYRWLRDAKVSALVAFLSREMTVAEFETAIDAAMLAGAGIVETK